MCIDIAKNNNNGLRVNFCDLLQSYENNEEMRQRSRRESSEQLQAPVVDKVCDLTCITDLLCNVYLEIGDILSFWHVNLLSYTN